MTFVAHKVYKKKGLTSSTFLFALYAISSIFSVIYVYVYGYEQKVFIKDYFTGFLYLALSLLIYLYPFYKVPDNRFIMISLPSMKVIYIVSWILCFLSIYSIIYFLPKSIALLSVDVDQIAGLRDLIAAGENPYIENNIFNTIAGTSASFYSLVMLFYFIVLTAEKKHSLLSIILIISTLSYPIFVLAYMGRDGIVFWMFSFIINYLLFRRFLPLNIKRILIKIGIFALIIGFIVLMVITIGRFLMSQNGSMKVLLFPFVDYMGQQAINFTELFSTGLTRMNYGSGVLPLIFGEGGGNPINIEQYGLVPWVFKTFMSTFYLSFGPYLTILLGIVMNCIYKVSAQTNRGKFSISFLVIYTLFITIYSQGVFYFRQMNRVGNLYIIVMILFTIYFAMLPKRVYLKSI